MSETTLEFAGESSTFQGTLPLDHPGGHEVRVLALDAGNANFGMVSQGIDVR